MNGGGFVSCLISFQKSFGLDVLSFLIYSLLPDLSRYTTLFQYMLKVLFPVGCQPPFLALLCKALRFTIIFLTSLVIHGGDRFFGSVPEGMHSFIIDKNLFENASHAFSMLEDDRIEFQSISSIILHAFSKSA